MRVYRVEHATEGHGPFNCANCNDDSPGLLRNKHEEYANMPGPWYDELVVKSYKDLFAFPSLSIYKDFWNMETLIYLKEKGYVLKVYDVTDKFVRIGKSGLQCCYNQRWAKFQFALELLAAFEV